MPPLRPSSQSFRDLVVWQKAHAFVLAAYLFSGSFPKWETYGLALQLRRAAVSIAANIAEGFGRRSRVEKLRFLNISEASLEECRYFLILAFDLGYGDTAQLSDLLEQTSKLLHAYSTAIRESGDRR